MFSLEEGNGERNHHIALCYLKNYSQHTSPTATNSDQNNSSITSPANEQTATCLVKSDTTVENHSQDHEKLSFHTFIGLVYVNIRTCKPACHLYYCILIRKFHSL